MTDIVVVTPVLNDWESASQLITKIGNLPDLRESSIHVICVDDGSTSIAFDDGFTVSGAVKRVSVLELQANQGHQRAIALGLAYAHQNLSYSQIVVMDSDGEDRPEDIPSLLRNSHEYPDRIIVAQRKRRSESLAFKFFYQIYKLLFALLTGKPISFGNFSVIPASKVGNVIFASGIWNNFAATLLKSRVPINFVETIRGKRYFGSSKMNFTSLMIHGLSAISIFSDIVIGRIIALLVIISFAVVAAISAVVYLKFATDTFVPGYATTVILFAVTILVVAIFTGMLSILSLLTGREQAATYPLMHLDSLTRNVWTLSGQQLVRLNDGPS